MTLVLFDLDLEDDLKKVYKDSQDTIKYLQDLTMSIENRVLDGETLEGFKIVEGKKTRFITEPGFKYLTKALGEEIVYETIKKPITLTKLEAIISRKEVDELFVEGYIAYKESTKKVELI